MNLPAILTLGFFLGMRHATDPDHLAAVSTIVTREKTLRAAAPIGMWWGLGHTATILMVGGGIVLFGLVIPERLGLGMELSAAVMLVLLGGLNLLRVAREAPPMRSGSRALRPLVVGTVHGLAGSAAVALVVLATLDDSRWAVAYLLVFGVGTIAGMLVITTALAMPLVFTARRYKGLHRGLGVASGFLSVALGVLLVYDIGFVQGLFTSHLP